METITVAWAPFEQTGLFWIAEDRGFFSQNGLKIKLARFDTGAGTLNAVLNGDADITVGVSEFPIVKSALQKSNVRIIAADARIEQQYLVARKDRGIEKGADLKGKRIGTTLGTISEFCLGRFLELNGLSMKDITEVDLKTPAEWENAVPDGTVDAVVTAQPYADLAARHLGANAIIWSAQSGQYVFGLVASSGEAVAKNPEPMRRFLKALVEAQDYALSHPAERKIIMQKSLNMDSSLVDSVWSRDQFSVFLDQSLVAAMEDEARWMISNNITQEKHVPDFNNYIYQDTLKAVKPNAVSIIR